MQTMDSCRGGRTFAGRPGVARSFVIPQFYLNRRVDDERSTKLGSENKQPWSKIPLCGNEFLREELSLNTGLFPVDFTFHTRRRHRTKYDQLGRACTHRLPLEDVKHQDDVDRDS